MPPLFLDETRRYEIIQQWFAVDDGGHAGQWVSMLRDMLNSVCGRDLVVYIGSAGADVLYYALTGIARLCIESGMTLSADRC
jgi:hypothetical protein